MTARQHRESSDGLTSDDSYRRRAKRWALLTGSRWAVAGTITALVGLSFVVLVASRVPPLLNVQSLFYAYSAVLTGNLTLVTVVVSINQLLLSRELKTPDEVESQIENVIEYRTRVEEAADRVAPVKPSGFLRVLVENTRERAQRLGGLTRGGGPTDEAADEIDDLVTSLTERMDRIDDLIGESDAATFNVLSLMLDTNYAGEIHDLRSIRWTYGSDIDDDTQDSIDDLIDRLQDIDIARQYFKSIYMQEELSVLSRKLLYTGLPSIVVAAGSLILLTVPTGQPGAAVNLGLLIPVTLTIGLLPLTILIAVFVRTATITKLTAATLPFTTSEQER